MNYCIRSFFLIFSFSTSIFAALGMTDNHWQCTTYDAANKHWSAQSIYKKIALNVAFSSCKKESAAPGTCTTTQGNCEQFIHGISIKPMWVCTALDRTALPWRSDLYSQRDDAALAAKAYCNQRSPAPETCYVNLVTCSNKNGL